MTSPANLSWDEYLPHGGRCGVSMGTNFPMGLPRLVTVMPSPVSATSSMSLRHLALNSEALIVRVACVVMLDTNKPGERNRWMAIPIQAQCIQSDHVVDHAPWPVGIGGARPIRLLDGRNPWSDTELGNNSCPDFCRRGRTAEPFQSPVVRAVSSTQSRKRRGLGLQQSCWPA